MHGSVSRLVVPVALLLAVGAGCSRKFFRERADADVAGVITQKNHFPDWAVKNWYAYPHPDARFADPYNPDRPPYPPDDAAARVLSPNPQRPTKKSGTGRYDGDGYLRLLQQWDAANRADDPADGRGVPPGSPERVVTLRPSFMGETQAPARTPELWATTPPPTRASRPMPTVPPVGPVVPEKGEWVAVKPRLTVDAIPADLVGPRITEDRGSPVVPASNSEVAKPAVVPQPPVTLPEIPQPSVPVEKLPTAPAVPQPVPNVPVVPQPKPGDPNFDPKGGAPAPLPNLGAGAASDDENAYLRALKTNQQGFRIKVDQAVELGLVNSREFQDRREDLYLEALPVTLERYNFAAQAFFTEQVVRDFTGSNLSGAGRLWSLNTTGSVGKKFATGGSLMVQFANQVVIELGSSRPDIAVSNLSLNFLQPFLRGGGYAVNLENLTQAERNLLYGMRSYARFRKLFYVATVAGGASNGGLTNNPYGLQGLSVNFGRGIGGNLTAPIVGYLPLLQQSAVIANQQRNVVFLERLLRLYQAFREGGQQSDLQVSQVEVQLLNSRGGLLGTAGVGGGGGGSGIRGFMDSLDIFKLQLGLPLTVGLDLDDTPLKPLRQQLAQFDQVYADVQKLEPLARAYNPNDPIEQFRPRWLRLLTESDLVRGTTFAKNIGARWDAWAKLAGDPFVARVAAIRKERTAILDRRADRLLKNQSEPEAETRRLAELDAELELAGFEQAVRAYETRAWAKLEGSARAVAQAAAFRDTFNAFYQVVLTARNERIDQTQNKWPQLATLPVAGIDVLTAPLDDAYTAGIQAALTARLDLMNARGQVVDAWRQIAVQANSLQGVFDVGYNYNGATPANGSQPFSFSGSRARQQLTFRAELPLVRRAERNNYRAALIAYQRQRRTLMAFEDNIANDVRNDIRELRTLAELYRIQQRVVALQYSQVDNAQFILLQPPVPGAANDAGSAAALTNQLLQAQGALLNAQNTLYTIWVNYMNARMALYLDLELMQLDDRGVWCDEQGPRSDSPPRPGIERQPERLPVPQPAGPADKR